MKLRETLNCIKGDYAFRWCFGAALVVILAGLFRGLAQTTNKSASADYSAFKIITDRNIFNPQRHARVNGQERKEANRPATVDSFSLVGTMSYAKGTFAFFDGSSSEYRKVLKPE